MSKAASAVAERPDRRRRRVTRMSIWFMVVALVGGVGLTVPVTTRQGLNFEVSTHRLPLYAKVLQFLDRSVQYRQIAGEITRGAVSDSDRVLRVFEWTRRQIRTTPPGWPIVDDHILHIIIRGHGLSDQQADVFATLSTYAGVPAFWSKARAGGPAAPGVVLSFARIDNRWRVFDVANAFVFRRANGDLATMDDLRSNPELVPAAARSIAVQGLPYSDIVTNAPMPEVPNPLRAELQMPSMRLWHELKVAVRLEAPDESE